MVPAFNPQATIFYNGHAKLKFESAVALVWRDAHHEGEEAAGVKAVAEISCL